MTDYQLTGKTALITGVSRLAGIGAAIARELARAGAGVFITHYRPYDVETSGLAGDADEVETLLTTLRGMAVPADGLACDLSNPDQIAPLFEAAERALGPVDILVNNATHSTDSPINMLTAEVIDRHYAVNMRGMMLLCAEFVRRYQGAAVEGLPQGRIINLSSGQALGPMPDELAYVATKGAVEAFTLSLSEAVLGRGITVNALDPGITDTGWITAEQQQTWQAVAPLGRLGLPEDAARLVRFLAAPASGWITGQVIHSRGGL